MYCQLRHGTLRNKPDDIMHIFLFFPLRISLMQCSLCCTLLLHRFWKHFFFILQIMSQNSFSLSLILALSFCFSSYIKLNGNAKIQLLKKFYTFFSTIQTHFIPSWNSFGLRKKTPKSSWKMYLKWWLCFRYKLLALAYAFNAIFPYPAIYVNVEFIFLIVYTTNEDERKKCVQNKHPSISPLAKSLCLIFQCTFFFTTTVFKLNRLWCAWK